MNNPKGTFYNPSKPFFKELADYIGSRRVLEVYAGNGLLASHLQKLGVSVHPTSIHSEYDGYKAHPYTEVEELSSIDAVLKYEKDFDILLVSWAVADSSLYHASLIWGSDKEIIYIGESLYGSIDCLPGCACDDFHANITPIHFFRNHQPRNGIERAFSCKLNYSKASS